MSRILYFDCFSGISGDMTLGALLDLGLSPAALEQELKKLGLNGYLLEVRPATKNSISGVDVTVHLTQSNQEHEHEHHHEHEHSGHKHHHEQEHHCDARNLFQITELILKSDLTDNAKKMAISIFTEIAKAESKVHGKPLEEVHFHEVGAVDSIVDIVGTAICLDWLNIDCFYCSAVKEGHGFVPCAHGLLPVPVPAVAEMLVGSRLILDPGDYQGELVTPTGFGILKTLVKSCGNLPPMQIEKVGYGFGKRETGALNALRIFLGSDENKFESTCVPQVLTECEDKGLNQNVSVIECTMDDETGETLGYALELLLEAGALDAFITPIYMKKSRPASKLTVVCQNQARPALCKMILKETSTLGLRFYEVSRLCLLRETETVETPLGPVRIKKAHGYGIEKSKAEYADCAALAKTHNLSLFDVRKMISACLDK